MNKKHTPLKRVTSRRVNFAFTALCCLSISSTPQAAPQGGQVSAGSGSIQASGNITQINQNSQQLVIDWDSFNVGLNESVTFLQPNSSAAVLNRIYDQNPSQIFGNINANGRVFLSNPNGMIFGANSQVNVGSLFATTLGINNDVFMNGRYNFSAVSDGGAIVNHGLLNAATGGSISLVADAVDNQGEIIAHYGYINLASGRTAAIDFDGDGFIHFEIDGEVLDNATGKTTGVNNSGIIRADGGEVLLTARHAQDVFERAINNDGLIEAGRMLNEGGVIRLVGIGGDVVHSGVIDASGQDQVSTGGDVQVLGDRVGLFEAAVIDVSGSSGGGTVLVGGDFQGNNSAIPNASQTLVSRDSRIIVDAQQSGDGGRVIIWADGYTRFLGDISATGGILAGNGGFVEVSGKQQLGFDGQVDTSANNGAVGQLLLDPTNIVVDSPSDPSGVAITDVDNFSDNSTCTDCTISAATLVAANADITLQATNNITFSEDLTLNADNNLVAEAENNIIIDAGITVATQGTGGITLTADADNNGSGNATMNTGSALQTAGGDVAINASGNIGLAGIDAGAGSVAITTGAGDIISNSSSVSAGTLNLSAVNGDIGTPTKQINTTVTTLSADTSIGGGDIFVTETDTINLAMINAGTGEINITATDIKAATDTNGNNISALTAAPLTLVASAGGIGASDNKINTTTGAMSLTTGGTAATGDIYIVESNSLNTSDITLSTLTGDTTPANNTQTVDITAGSLNLDANFGNTNDHLLLTASTGGISGNSTLSSNDLTLTADTAGQAVGSSGTPINTVVSGNLTASASNGTGGIYLSNTGALSITSVNAGTGDISISATDINGNGTSMLTAASLTLDASAGGIGAAGNKINTTTTGTISLTTGGAANTGDIYIVESNSLNTSDITLSTLTSDTTPANNTQTVDITADSLNLDANFGNTEDHLLLTASTGGISGNSTLSSNDLTLTADTAGQAVGSSGTPINTDISGNLTASASNGTGGIYLSNTGALSIASINAGTGNVELTASGTIIESITNTTIDVTAASLSILDAAGVGASTANGALDLAVDNLNIAQATPGAIYLTGSGDIALGVINGTGQTVSLVAAGNITDNGSNIMANDLTLITTGNGSAIGATGSANVINTTVTGNLTVAASTGNGGIYLSNAGALSITSINAGTGDISIGATDINGNGISTLTAASLTLDASAGGIGAAGNKINTTTTGTISLTTGGTAGAGDIYIVESNSLNTSDITLNTLTGDATPANNIQTVDITADSLNLGAVFGNTEDHLLLTASTGGISGNATLSSNNLTLTADTAGQAVGSSGTPINTDISGNLTARASNGTGGIYLSNTGALAVASVDAGAGAVELTATGAITDATLDAGVDISGTAIALTATGIGAGTTTADALNINGTTLAVSSPGGAIYVTEADNIGLGVINGSGQTVYLNAAGNITDNSSSVQAANLTLIATGNGSAIGATGAANVINATVTGNLTATASTGNGGIYLSNTDALAVASVDAGAGAVELTATGAITDATLDAGVDISGTAIALTATGIGAGTTTADALNINGTTLAVSSPGGAIYVTEADNIGLGVINGSGQTVYLNAAGNITDSSSLVSADTLFLEVSTDSSVGGSSASINTDLSGALTVTATGSGGIYINEADSSTADGLSLSTINADSGDVDIMSVGSIFGAGSSITGDTLTIASTSGSVGGSATDPVNTTVTTLNATASTGVFIADSAALNLASLSAGSGDINISAAGTLGINTTGFSPDVLTLNSVGSQNYTASTINLYDDLVTNNSGITLDGDVRLFNPVSLDTNTGGGDIVITGGVDSDDSSLDGLSIRAGTGNVDLLGGIGQIANLYGLDVTTNGTLLLTGNITTNASDISLSASQISLADTMIGLSTGNGPGNISLSGNVDSVSSGSTQLTLQAGSSVTGGGDVDLSNAVVGSLISFNNLYAEGSNLLLNDVTTNYSQVYVGPTTISGDATFAVTSTDANSDIRFLSSVTGSSTNNLSITASSNLGRIVISNGINNVNNLSISGETVTFGAPASIIASDSINLTLGGASSILYLDAFGAEGLSNNTDLLSISTLGSIDVDGVTINSALTLSAIGGSSSQIVFSADSEFTGNLTVLADDGIEVNARIETTSTGADINLNSDANNTAESNDNILFAAADISSGGSLIMSATNGGIELQGGTTTATGTTVLNIPNGGLDISGISVDGQSDPSLIYILDIVTNNDVRLGDIGQNNLIDSLSVTTANNNVYLYGDISTRRGDGVDLGSDITSVILADDVSIDTTTGNGSVSLTALEGAYSLNINSGNGGISLTGIGQNTALTALTVTNQGTTALTGNITTSATGGIDFSGAQDIDMTGDIRLTANNAGSIRLTGGTVDGDSGLTLVSTGITHVGGALNLSGDLDLSNASNIVVDNNLTLTSNSAILGGSISTAAGVGNVDLSGAGAITLSSDLLLDSSASDAGIDISGVDITGSGSLSVVSGTGDITLNNITDITALSVSGSGLTTLAGNLSTTGTGGVDLGDASNILLGSNISIDTTTNSGRIDLTGGGIEGPNSLTLTTNDGAILLGNMGQNVALSSLTVNSTGDTTFDNAIISTQGSGIDLTAATDVNITGDVVLNSSSGSGVVYLDGGAVDGAGGLTVNVNRGDLFLGTVGQDVPLAYLTLSGDDLNQIAGNITTIGNVDFSAANIDSIDPAIDLLINAGSGDVSLAEVGATVPFLSLTVITSGNVNLSDNITTQGTGIDFTGAGSMTLGDGSDITIDTSQADDGAILLNGGLSLDGNGSLSLLANLGAIELGDIGQTTAIAALTTSSNGTTTLAGAVSSTGEININTGSIAQNGNITSTTGNLAITSESDIVMDAAATSTTAGQPINYTSTTGDIYVAQIDAGNGTVSLNAPLGNVYSSLGDNVNLALSQPNISGSTATINSGGAIGRSSASGITIDATSSIQLTFGADIAYINNVQGVPVRASGRVIDVLADRKAMAAVGHSGGLEADALAQTAGDFAILPQEQSLFLIAGPNNQFAAQYDDAEVISIINPDVPTLLHTKDAWIFKRPEEKDEKDKRRGASWF